MPAHTAAETSRLTSARLPAAPSAYAAPSALGPRGRPNNTSVMAPKPGGVVSSTPEKTPNVTTDGTSQVQDSGGRLTSPGGRCRPGPRAGTQRWRPAARRPGGPARRGGNRPGGAVGPGGRSGRP